MEAEVNVRTVFRWLLKPLATPLFFVGFLFIMLGSRFKKSAGSTLSFMTGAFFIVLGIVADGGVSPGRRLPAKLMERDIELELETETSS